MQAGSVLHLRTKFEADSYVRSKVIWGSKISKLAHMTQATPFWGRFKFPMQAESALHLCTKLKADCSIRSKLLKGSRN